MRFLALLLLLFPLPAHAGSLVDLQSKLNQDQYSDQFFFEEIGANIKGRHPGALFPPAGGTALTDNQIRFVPVIIPESSVITSITFGLNVLGSFTADQTNSIALYSTNGTTLTKVAETASDSTIFTSGTAGSFKTVSFAVPYSAQPGLYFAGFLFNASATVTAPSVLGLAPAGAYSGATRPMTGAIGYVRNGQNSQDTTFAVSALTLNNILSLIFLN